MCTYYALSSKIEIVVFSNTSDLKKKEFICNNYTKDRKNDKVITLQHTLMSFAKTLR